MGAVHIGRLANVLLTTTGKVFQGHLGGEPKTKRKGERLILEEEVEESDCYHGFASSSSDGGCHPTLPASRGSVWQHWLAYGTWFQPSLEKQHGGDGQEAQGEDGGLEKGA